MNHKMQKALLLAENIKGFLLYVEKHKNNFMVDADKMYQVKLFIKEYKFKIIADELHRINQFEWDEKYTYYLVDSFQKGLTTIDEYVQYNYNDLFILTARLYTLKNLSQSFVIQ
ncbi:hypothetical protein [Robertmurraya korlensis]|jgi:hypothetical protein|uniref:hypothetical protein n=1 Tax=Robertmurraya korlensis TaxID=519977 RepID=UPI00082594EE|nr:hypothetical protein [Robertmurraya korlensis]